MINKIVVFFILSILILGCKDKQEKPLTIKDDLNNLFNLSNYQASRQQKINDSIIQYEGENNRFLITGKYNYLKKYKTSWWNVYDKKSKEKYLDLEFFKEYGNPKELNNQIIFYRGNKVNTFNSKFYTKEYNAKNKTILYNFYCSKSSNKPYSAKINIGIISNEKPIMYPVDFECTRITQGQYQFSLDISEYSEYNDLNIIGLFSEYSTNNTKNELGIDQIFINDTITTKR